MEKGAEVFASKGELNQRRTEAEREQLYKTIGHQQVVIEWFKKKLGITHLPSERP